MPLDMSRYLDLFVQESTEHLEAMGRELLALEKGEGAGVVDGIFRHAHSVKGMAASMGFELIAELAHRLEDLFDLPRKGVARLEGPDIDLALAVADGLSALVAAAGAGSPLEEAGVDATELARRLSEAHQRLSGARAGAGPHEGFAGEGAAGETPASAAAGASAPGALASPASAAAGASAPGALASPASAATGTLPAAAPPGASDKPGATATPAAGATSRPHLRISVVVAGTSKVPGVRGFLVHKRISALGEVIASEPSLPDLKAGRMPGNRLLLLVATEAGEEPVRQALATVAELDSVEVEVAGAPPPEAPVAQPAHGGPREAVRMVRVRTDLLDGFMDSVGELLLAAERLRVLVPHNELEGPGPLEEAVDGLSGIVKDLHRRVMVTRMTPLATITDRLPRVVRETARRLGREVDVTVEGAEIELDRAILDEIDTPLGHILRNCVDHGIEAAHERIDAGKPVAGQVRLQARRDRDRVVVEVTDDGRGFDLDRLRGKAVDLGLISARQAEQLSDRDALMLACHPGISTMSQVSDVSGRGVGMDVVKATVESLGGTLEIFSRKGQGATFALRLPLTVAIQRLLLVGVGGEVFGVPVNKVVHVVEPMVARTSARGRPMVPFLDGLVPAFDLGRLLAVDGKGADARPHVVVEGEGRSVVALSVDALVGQLEAVIKPLGRPLDLLGGLSGVTILPDGRPVFVLDLASLVRSAESGPSREH